MILGALIIPIWVATKVGWDQVQQGLGGVAGTSSFLDPHVAFSFGIVTSIGLLAGSISDQQYWQRVFAIKPDHMVRSYVWGGIMFGIVPLLLAILGFVAASPASGIAMPEGVGLPMIGIEVVVRVLPLWAAVFFVIMLLCGLMSTLDSGMCAASSLYAIDMAPMTAEQRAVLLKEKTGQSLTEDDKDVKSTLDRQTIKSARLGMYGISVVGLALAFIVQYLFSLDRLWWIFNGVATCFVVPTVLSLYYDRLSAKGVISGICGAGIGMIAFIYGNWVQNDVITVFSALFIVVISLVCCLLFKRAVPWSRSNA
jgi:urea-proton symporter